MENEENQNQVSLRFPLAPDSHNPTTPTTLPKLKIKKPERSPSGPNPRLQAHDEKMLGVTAKPISFPITELR